MKTVLVTGAQGFLGKHLVEALRRNPDTEVLEFHRGMELAALADVLPRVSVIHHLAGVNRPADPGDFATGNHGLTAELCRLLTSLKHRPLIVYASTIQALLDNPYGRSKRQAEVELERWAADEGGRAVVFRLPNVFGKWCRPNYNSAVATFCHNIARDLPITISDRARELELVYVDDVVAAFLGAQSQAIAPGQHAAGSVPRTFRVTLGRIADALQAFRAMRSTLVVPRMDDEFDRRLYATYLSYLEQDDFAYGLLPRSDQRGTLAEFVKQGGFGQIFVSRTLPGVTRGNHYHHTKTEKFLVLEGDAIVRFRSLLGGGVIEYPVHGRDLRVVDIPPGYTHSIENVGRTELITLFWASEVFDPAAPDTIACNVLTPSSP
ncbi:NAD-dependent epimerase/dehydratase family protein [Lacunisphaera limnophila]|uniref:polysaccharide biosynthesis C-terminal domain-containing protein n=1 Tax=Lacunisphaera limnophila TaxID=1838286 RepID=UPI000859A739|nr:NAD-dependent epimerase/dehydratase family protein [Lacunisphaera limnophila]